MWMESSFYMLNPPKKINVMMKTQPVLTEILPKRPIFVIRVLDVSADSNRKEEKSPSGRKLSLPESTAEHPLIPNSGASVPSRAT